MKIIKRYMCLLLSFVFLFSSIPINVYATNTNINGNTGGGGSSGAAGGGGGNASPFTTSNEKQGYRFTFINNETGERMSKTIDILRSKPGNVKYFTGSLIDGLDSSYYGGYAVYSDIEPQIAKVVFNYNPLKDRMPWWYVEGNGHYTGNSDAFADWLLSDAALSNLSGVYAPLLDDLEKQNFFSTGVVTLTDETLTLIKNNGKSLLEMIKNELNSSLDIEEQYIYCKYFSYFRNVLLAYAESLPGTYSIYYILDTCNLKDLFEDVEKLYQHIYLSTNNFEVLDMAKQAEIDDKMVFSNMLDLMNYQKNLGKTEYKLDATSIDNNSSENNSNSELVNASDGVKLENLFTDGKYNAQEYGFIIALLNVLGTDGYSIFNLESDKSVSSKEAINKLGNSFLKNECSLIVEPIFWCSPRNFTTGKNWTEEIYGTPRNWSSYMINHVQNVWPRGTGFSDVGLDNYRAINVAFFNAMSLNEDEVTLSESQSRKAFLVSKPFLKAQAAKVKDGAIAFSEMNNRVNKDTETKIGLGMHIYAARSIPKEYNTLTPNPGIPPILHEGPNIRVIKYYRTTFGDGNSLPNNYYSIEKAPRTMTISDEKEYGWSLVGYFTSENDYKIPNNESIFKYTWDKAVEDNPKGTYYGTKPGRITIKESDPDKTVLILFEKTDDKKEENTKKVIKVYENEKCETEKVTEPEVITGTTYEVPVEEDYIYTESKKSDNPSKTITGWTDTEGSPSTDSKITIDDSTETIYILYQKNTNKQLKLYSNELSYTYGLIDLLENRVLFSIYDTIPKSPGTEIACKGHTRYDGCGDEDSSCPGHSYTCSNGTHSLTDSSWTIKVSNNYDYVGLTTYLRDYENTSGLGGSWSVSSSSVGGVDISYTSSKTAKPDGTFLLYRDKASDLVTLYPRKNDSLSSSLKTLGIETDSASYTPHGDRMGIELSNDSSFTRDFITGFEYTEHENKLAWKWPRTQCHFNDNKDSFLTHTVTSPADANAFYNKTNSIKEYYLLGQRNTGNEEISDVRDTFGTKYSYNKAYSSSSADLKFYPYHLMLYRAKNANNSPQNVYVTSENLSTMKVYNAVQLGVYKKNPINALLSSTQWSTHARSLSFSANTDKKSVLPGGAVLDLDMGSKGDTELGIRLWQACLRDEQVETVQQDGFTTSLSKAKEIASNYQSEVKDVLEGYGLVQWGTEGVQTDLNGVLGSGVELHNNTSLDWDNRSYNTSNDSKYYLKHNGSGSDRANFDVLDTKITKQVFYEISSDVDGNVILKKDNTEIARASLSQDKSAILSNAEAKLLDDNTKLVSNYFSSIDRGLGDPDKYDRTNSRKYNEAYDGVGVLLTELSFDVGFRSNSGHRTTVLDTLLTSSSESKSDLYNFSNEKVRSFVFATTENTTGSVESESEGYIGTLSGDSTMNDLYTVLSDIQSFVYTKNFYTSNFNVTDLN